ncbi:MAG: DNA-binding transcriptional regulator [Tepidisphaeraceae bacterium]
MWPATCANTSPGRSISSRSKSKRRSATWLRDWQGDGIIAGLNDPSALALANQSIPVVDVSGILTLHGIPTVRANHAAVGRLGAEHLLERGFRHFAFCAYLDWDWSQLRKKQFMATVIERGGTCALHELPFPDGPGGPVEWEQQQRAMAAWIHSLPKPVGVMAVNDLMGQRLLEACQRLGIHVPEQVAVVGCDNDEMVCQVASPPLSSVIINDHQRGYEAAALLDRLMQGERQSGMNILVEPGGVVTRASTDIMAIEDELVVQALRFIRDHACDGIGVTDVVLRVPISRGMLERRFRKVVGRTINNELVRVRINRAIELLSQTDLELKVVAHKAGFGNQSYMTSVFQERVGRTPGSYR